MMMASFHHRKFFAFYFFLDHFTQKLLLTHFYSCFLLQRQPKDVYVAFYLFIKVNKNSFSLSELLKSSIEMNI